VNRVLLASWLPPSPAKRLLKTDLFDEAFGEGLYPLLMSRARCVIGTDLSPSAFQAARARWSGLTGAAADVRHLPFAGGAFDCVVSNSTLDHFESVGDIGASLQELYRVLEPGSRLLLTLDNRANPVIALRSVLPFRLLSTLGLVPYYVGATCGPRRLCRLLRRVGFEVLEIGAVMHCPRVFAVPAARLLERHTLPRTQRRFLRLLLAFERLGAWPTRFLTGHFVAVSAIKPSP
jgi:SAM-dependent methyltransferase